MPKNRISPWLHRPAGHLSVREASRIADVAIVTVCSWIRAGCLPAQRAYDCRRLWIKEADLHEWLRIYKETRAESHIRSKRKRGRKPLFTPEQKRVLERMIQEALADQFRAISRKL